MPNRVLREGLIYSEAINRVSEGAEMLYVRMLAAADDFGLIEIGAAYLKSRCLPARNVDLDRIDAMVAEMTKPTVGLVRPYEVDGKRYGAIEKWDQRRFALKPKCPLPPWGTDHIRGGYVDPRARATATPAAAPKNGRAHRAAGNGASWRTTDAGICAKAMELKIDPRGHNRDHLLRLIDQALNAQGNHAP